MHWCLNFYIPFSCHRSKIASCQRHSSHTDLGGVFNTLHHADLNYMDENNRIVCKKRKKKGETESKNNDNVKVQCVLEHQNQSYTKLFFQGSTVLNKPIKWFISLPEQNGYYLGGMPVVLSA